jgi:hypothetical protein
MTRFVALESGEISYHRRTSILHDKKTADRYISSTELYGHIFLDNGKNVRSFTFREAMA